MRPEDIIKRPLILTEKGNRLREQDNQFLFEVARGANKTQIRGAIEKLWKVSVLKVHTLNVRGRMRRMGRGHAKTQNWKKAIVSLKKGDSIDFFEGS
jgi:large subunit ribosomal protein L23